MVHYKWTSFSTPHYRDITFQILNIGHFCIPFFHKILYAWFFTIIIYVLPIFSLLGMSLPKERLRIGLTAVEQISEVVRYAHENDLRLRAVGSGASWSKLTNVRDILIGKRRNSMLSYVSTCWRWGKIKNVFHVSLVEVSR